MSAGKGDTYRPVDLKKYRARFADIKWGSKVVWVRDKQGKCKTPASKPIIGK